MQEIIIRGSRYRIRQEEPPAGWEPTARYLLESVSAIQEKKRGKIEEREQVRRFLRATSREACIRYIAQIEKMPLFSVRAAIINKSSKEA
ncbi:hypothetical protein [Nitratifractor salsuginis]|uniref:Uncharacterized protein n=1 Tax=Nitratifractor salsuginis (strain DSM 16511 / JCM 12458 / E9I37-1) TaxID=749222 RepID=E6WYC4_NITSE|nr:hypothetical protein [Nitratifractor salsuginis]ADV46436.1 hypothetical protein Nitsa_1183 [Nitratifractor salsuginis DSM 16511]